MESGLRDVKMPTVTQVLYNDLGFKPGPVSDSKTHEATLPPTTNGINSKVTEYQPKKEKCHIFRQNDFF